MPEYPDITIYIEKLSERLLGHTLDGVRLRSFFFLRSPEPPVTEAEGREVERISRIGKRIVISLAGDLHLLIHLMITGRFRWRKRGAGIPGRVGLAAFDFAPGTLLVTEQGSKKRASLHLVAGESGLAAHDPGGIDPLNATPARLRKALTRKNHTLKRALTDPRILSGIGNAYSDEILHRAGLSPFLTTEKLDAERLARLRAAIREVLPEWADRLRAQAGSKFPEKVTAFHPEMAVHGKYGEPCPKCGSEVQRVVYAENEMNYCARCQTGGRLLADRSLSRLLKADWPKTIDELEGG